MEIIVDKISRLPLDTFSVDKLNTYQQKKSKNISSFASYYLLDKLLLKYNLNLKDIKYENGKPILENYFLSVTHKDDYVAVAINEKEIGIDIEKIKEVPLNLPSKILTEDEITFLSENNDYKQTFFQIYTAKECVIKINNYNLSDIKKFSVVTENQIKYENYNYRVHRLEDYILTIIYKN